MTESASQPRDWRAHLPAGVRPYTESAPLAALFLGISSGFPYAMIGATLTTRLAQDGIDKKTVTAFSLAFLVYNLKFLWAWMVDGVRLPEAFAIGSFSNATRGSRMTGSGSVADAHEIESVYTQA